MVGKVGDKCRAVNTLILPTTNSPAAINAPVLPAEIQASAVPSATCWAARTIEAFFFGGRPLLAHPSRVLLRSVWRIAILSWFVKYF